MRKFVFLALFGIISGLITLTSCSNVDNGIIQKILRYANIGTKFQSIPYVLHTRHIRLVSGQVLDDHRHAGMFTTSRWVRTHYCVKSTSTVAFPLALWNTNTSFSLGRSCREMPNTI